MHCRFSALVCDGLSFRMTDAPDDRMTGSVYDDDQSVVSVGGPGVSTGLAVLVGLMLGLVLVVAVVAACYWFRKMSRKTAAVDFQSDFNHHSQAVTMKYVPPPP